MSVLDNYSFRGLLYVYKFWIPSVSSMRKIIIIKLSMVAIKLNKHLNFEKSLVYILLSCRVTVYGAQK